ncbi:uncharacterized protein LOC124167740 [Ischnura elegans]|uniref:uncharacterized protein LOC124167740 n=1 Tax=Ischnura elegans TaxID=197161 RepID=UPI001ED8A453|nr:uncharacterized protein LOC124167740 [Ischnura elegans]
MVACAAYGCNNHKDKKKPGVTYHKFPKREERRAAWVKAVRRENWSPSSASVLCSEHFRPEDMDRTSLCYVRLRENAIPSIFPAFPSYLKTPSKQRRQVTRRKIPEVQDSQPPSDAVEAMQIDTPEDTLAPVADPATPSTSHDCCNEVAKLRSELKRVQALYLSAKRKVKALQQSKRRHIKRQAKLSKVLATLKKKNCVSVDGLNILENISGQSKELLNRLLLPVNGKPHAKKYGAELRAFALTLNFYSPRAYKFVRKTFNTCLPHPRTISKWYSSMNGSPGVTMESLNTLRLQVNQSKYPIYCTLLVDDMAIRKHVEWDGFKYHGYVNFGTEFSDDDIPVAKEATVFMIVGVNANWKIPVAFFLSDGISGEQRANLMLQVLHQVHDTGAIVTAVTFDGAASNLAMARTLGCQFAPPDYATYFAHPVTKNPIYVFLDPSHMIKLIRNTLGEKKTLVHGSHALIKWEFIEKLKALQDSEGLHLANKLKNAHVHWQKQKMKVKLATQLISNSVADAIEFCSELGVDEFQGSQGGFNNNPTARQFSSAYKKLLVQCQVSGISQGNCLPLEELKILNVGSGSGCNSLGILNGTACHGSAAIEEDPTSHDHCYFLPHPHDLSEVADSIVAYIAGFVVRTLEKKVKCGTCCAVLRGDGNEACGLIQKKDRGGLVMPSHDVVKICRHAERLVRASLHSVKVNILYIVSSVLKMFGGSNVFHALKDHALEQEPENNHWVHLIRSVCHEYVNIRLHYVAKCRTESLQAVCTPVSPFFKLAKSSPTPSSKSPPWVGQTPSGWPQVSRVSYYVSRPDSNHLIQHQSLTFQAPGKGRHWQRNLNLLLSPFSQHPGVVEGNTGREDPGAPERPCLQIEERSLTLVEDAMLHWVNSAEPEDPEDIHDSQSDISTQESDSGLDNDYEDQGEEEDHDSDVRIWRVTPSIPDPQLEDAEDLSVEEAETLLDAEISIHCNHWRFSGIRYGTETNAFTRLPMGHALSPAVLQRRIAP